MVANFVVTVWDRPGATALLRRLWIDGVPCSAMAARISHEIDREVSKNAVIGKVHRLGLHRDFPRGDTGGAEAQRVVKTMRSKAKQVKKATKGVACLPPEPPIIADVSNARPWLERERGQCAFPLGQRGAVMSCCAPTEETYCPSHRKAMGGLRKPYSGKDHVRPQAHPQERRETPLFERFTGAEAA